MKIHEKNAIYLGWGAWDLHRCLRPGNALPLHLSVHQRHRTGFISFPFLYLYLISILLYFLSPILLFFFICIFCLYFSLFSSFRLIFFSYIFLRKFILQNCFCLMLMKSKGYLQQSWLKTLQKEKVLKRVGNQEILIFHGERENKIERYTTLATKLTII